jgi:hypothetical protein
MGTQMLGLLRLGLSPEVTIDITVPAPVSSQKVKMVNKIAEKNNYLVIPDDIVDENQKIPGVIPEGSKCTGSEVFYHLNVVQVTQNLNA